MWEAGRPVSTIVVGERGSGKTSLINCALKGPLVGLPVIRGEFNARVASAGGVREFVAQLCGTTPDELETTLLAERRVVVLPDCQVVTDLFLPPDVDPRVAMEVGYDAAFTSPYLLLRKPVVVLLIDKFDQRPYVVLRIKAYVYDHRFEPRLQSDVTMRAKTEFRRRGVLAGWRDAERADPALSPPASVTSAPAATSI